ncbi:hypothetical protein MRX96_007731 [Rhipicephalus microplus]
MCSKRGLSGEEIDALVELSSDSGADSEEVDWEPLLTDIGTSSRSGDEKRRQRAYNSDTLSFQNDHVAGIRPVIDALNEAFCSAVDPEEYQSVHEMVIPFKRRSSIKRYLPSKP